MHDRTVLSSVLDRTSSYPFFVVKTISLCLLLSLCLPCWSQLMISEFMADNTVTIAYNDGAFNDWIEILQLLEQRVDSLNCCHIHHFLSGRHWCFRFDR